MEPYAIDVARSLRDRRALMVLGFDGETSLLGERGWLLRNDIGRPWDRVARSDLPGLSQPDRIPRESWTCGIKPVQVFIRTLSTTARSQSWPEDLLHYEFFAADVSPSEGDESFEVQIVSSGQVVVIPKDRTVT